MAWRNYTSSNRSAHQESFKAPALRPGFFIACPAILSRSSRNLTSMTAPALCCPASLLLIAWSGSWSSLVDVLPAFPGDCLRAWPIGYPATSSKVILMHNKAPLAWLFFTSRGSNNCSAGGSFAAISLRFDQLGLSFIRDYYAFPGA
jgi:hypothetical protein